MHYLDVRGQVCCERCDCPVRECCCRVMRYSRPPEQPERTYVFHKSTYGAESWERQFTRVAEFEEREPLSFAPPNEYHEGEGRW